MWWTLEGETISGTAPEQSLLSLLDGEITAALISGSSETTVQGCTVYWAHAQNMFWFTSQETTHHVAALRADPHCGLVIWRRPAQMGDQICGAQFTGLATEALDDITANMGIQALNARFPRTQATLQGPSSVIGRDKVTCLFKLTMTGLTFTDEATLGQRRHLPLRWGG
jgi:hypothetical protein